MKCQDLCLLPRRFPGTWFRFQEYGEGPPKKSLLSREKKKKYLQQGMVNGLVFLVCIMMEKKRRMKGISSLITLCLRKIRDRIRP